MKQDTQRIIADLNAMVTLVDKFPMSILSYLNFKPYNSPFEFILDVLAAIGVNPREYIDELLYEIFQMTIKWEDGLLDKVDETTEKWEKKPASDFLIAVEEQTKVILVNLLAGITSCSAIPIIPDKDLDTEKDSERGIDIPIELLDINNILSLSPFSKEGKSYYDPENDKVSTVNSLYKTYDMNSFIWFVTHKGNEINQYEINKQMWDSRWTAFNHNIRKTDEEVNYWITSKTEPSSLNEDSVLKFQSPNEIVDKLYYPILQLSNRSKYGNMLNITFPAQRYVTKTTSINGEKKKNKTMYDFNTDYIKSIEIFNPKVILSYLVEALFNFRIGSIAQISIEESIIDAKIAEIVDKIIIEDDASVTDCYFIFSNDDYNQMLQNTINQKYKTKKYGDTTIPYVSIDVDTILNELDAINKTASPVEKITKITKMFNDISVTPGNLPSTELGLQLNFNPNWYREILRVILTPFVKCLFSPQVMLLILINLRVMGLVSFENFFNTNDILSYVINKLMGIVMSIARYIKDLIIEFSIKFIEKHIKPLIENYLTLQYSESLEYWLELLNEAINCIPIPVFASNERGAGMDEVNYADIVPVQTLPEKNC